MSQYDMQTGVAVEPRAHRFMTSVAPRPLTVAIDQPTAEQPSDATLPLLNEDLAQLRSILIVLGLGAGCRREGATPLQVLLAPAHIHYSGGAADDSCLDPEVPLYRPCGRRYGSLGILSGRDTLSDGMRMVIEALLAHAAETISERWFRRHHHNAWVLAAAPSNQLDSALLLALDQQLALQGMNYRAARLLDPRLADSGHPNLADFFHPLLPFRAPRLRVDIPLRLTRTRDGTPWTGVLTPPDCDPSAPWTADAVLHARPRCHGLSDLTTFAPFQPPGLAALTPGMRRKVEDFIEAHLEMPLPVERLAQVAGMSCSHFSRAFRNVLKMTPHRYVMWRRFLRAQELIKTSDASLVRIAVATGFSDQSHLSRIFLQNMGESPRQFRRRCQ